MRQIAGLIVLVFCSISLFAQEKIFSASTPAGESVRKFLGISLKDSVNFIRWRLSINGQRYNLVANYGIGKPNTNGFVDGGKNISFEGQLTTGDNSLMIQRGPARLRLAVLNDDLLHIADDQARLLVGNAAWSYTLNSLQPSHSPKLGIRLSENEFADSMVYVGRTPCAIPGIASSGTDCYKLKWIVILYPAADGKTTGRYRIRGSISEHQYTSGSWKKIVRQDGHSVFDLADEQGRSILHLLNTDNNVLVMTDAAGRLLVGDHDFSYTLNRQF